MSPSRLSLIAGVCTLALLASVRPCAAEPAPGYYRDAERGWVWYENPPPPPPEPKPVPPPQGGANAAPAAAPALSAEWFRTKLPNYRDAAIDKPTDNNVALYLYLQRLAMEKADRFKNVAQRVVMNYPGLDEDQSSPQSSLAKTAARKISRDTESVVMKRLASGAGLWYFFRSDCPYCHAQGPVLQILQHLYGFKILPISLDGKPTPDGVFPEFRADSGQGAKLGVRVTPSLFLVTAQGAVLPIAEGLQSLSALEDRVFSKGHDAKLVTDTEFAEATWRPSRTLLEALPAELPPELANDPTRFTDVLRAAAMDGGGTAASSPVAPTPQAPLP